ncbi:MAG: carboxypeptidase regulatory-like domain-containing protein, partial [Acidobacteriaceae bacterium]|nr:carboxypeptidase regulatory-like domain-containing protein [Acidobacteriaceae bacterium]
MPFVLFSACAWSQTQLATVSGSINDPSGAVISEATIAIVNQSTGVKREMRTRATGDYRFAGL